MAWREAARRVRRPRPTNALVGRGVPDPPFKSVPDTHQGPYTGRLEHYEKEFAVIMDAQGYAPGDALRSALHKETFYGCIRKPGETADVFVVRKPLVGPVKAALSLVDRIVDPTIKKLVSDRLHELIAQGVKNVLPGDITMPSGVPINKIRIEAQTTNPSKLRDHAIPSGKDYKTPFYVTSAEGSNFRLALLSKSLFIPNIPKNPGGKPAEHPENMAGKSAKRPENAINNNHSPPKSQGER